MAIARSLGVLAALLIGSEFAPAQEVTVSGRLIAQASSLVGKHYVQAYTLDSRPDNPLRSVQVSSTDFDAVLIVVSPEGKADSDDDSAGDQNARLRIAPQPGEWLFVVTSSELLRPGSFSLTVDGPRPMPTNRRRHLKKIPAPPPPRGHFLIDTLHGIRASSAKQIQVNY